MAQFKDGMLHAYATARDAFAALDASLTDLDAALDNDPLDMEDFVRGTRNFKPALTEEQATYAFKGLDVDKDGRVELDEFVGVLKSGGFFRATTTSTPGDGRIPVMESAPITVANFKASMLRAYPSAPAAFAALDASETNPGAGARANPISLKQFVRGTQLFSPPLTQVQAEFAFRALDADANGVLVSAEFCEGLARGEFRPRRSAPGETALGATPGAARADEPTTPTTPAASTTAAAPTAAPAAPAAAAPAAPAPTPPAAPLAAVTPPGRLPRGAAISMEEFKARMLSAHASALKAFQALGANPARLEDFVRGMRTFEPPLSQGEAVYAFEGFDADHDHSISSFEFFEVLQFGRFFPTLRDLVQLGSAEAGRTTRRPAGRGAPPAAARPRAGPGHGLGAYALEAVALAVLLPLLLALVPCARSAWRQLAGEGGAPYRVLSLQPPACPGSAEEAPRRRQRQRPQGPRRARPGWVAWLFACCVQQEEEEAEQVPGVPAAHGGQRAGRAR